MLNKMVFIRMAVFGLFFLNFLIAGAAVYSFMMLINFLAVQDIKL